MAIVKEELTRVKLREDYKVVYERREILFGLISWEVKVKEDSLGKDLEIVTEEKYDRIIINGEVVKK